MAIGEKTSKTLVKNGGRKLVDLSIKNLQTLWETGRKKLKDLVISKKNLSANA